MDRDIDDRDIDDRDIDELDIDELALAALDGDQEAWTKLFKEVNPRLWALLRYKGCNPTDAEQLAQDAWTRFLENLERFDRTRHFLPFFFTIAVRIWIDWWRKERHRKKLEQNLPEDVVGVQPLPYEPMLEDEMTKHVQHCMNTLDAMERQIIGLRFWDGKGYKDMRDQFDQSESAVRSKGYRAVKKFADCIKSYLFPAASCRSVAVSPASKA